MSIVSMDDLRLFCSVDVGYFVIDASHNVLVLTYDSTGTTGTPVDVTDGTYNGDGLAAELQTQARTDLSATELTVTYDDSDDKKFTITAASTGSTGTTIKYTNTGSDAGLTFGFNQDHAAAVSITSDLSAGNPSTILETIRDSVEDWVENYCHRTFESASYAKYYDGNDEQYIQLDDYPITALIRVATGRRSAIRVKNTADYTMASISVTTGGLILTKDGVSNSTGVTFTGSTSMSAVVTAIDALDSWSAVIESSDYTNFKSSELVEMFGKSAIDDNWVYLDMPDQAIDDFEVAPARGEMYRGMGWPDGDRNIFVEYTAGYSSTTMPEDLQLAIEIIVKSIYDRRTEGLFGTSEYWVGDVKVKCEAGDIPKEAVALLSKYRRVLI